MLKLETPNGEKNVLLHACCAPCSSAIIECLLQNDIRPTVFYYNPNIFPKEEYEIRKAESLRYVKSLNLDFVDADYNHSDWREQIRGLENEPERGRRCVKCFIIRMLETARYASENGFTLFTTTLASSRWKNLADIFDAGRYAAKQFPGVALWEQNWRKGGLSERRLEIISQYDFYNQQYCGCEFSFRKSK
ncbi:epoxyqueuosine reductase QueH [Massilibacteroides vaginae]|uniref:epoxyqueuosine reductase QueH n=1 Tax=Massilibacteroides vaginae TaxID=1673718 RepID=UPI000A1C8CA2|nr:epoxyqueuosine reductase QueH [Massilibacteroides vaginae]